MTHLRAGGPGGLATRLSLSPPPPPRLGEASFRLGEASFLPAGLRLRGLASLRGAAAGDRALGLSRSLSFPPRRAGGEALRRGGGEGRRLGGGGRATGERGRCGERPPPACAAGAAAAPRPRVFSRPVSWLSLLLLPPRKEAGLRCCCCCCRTARELVDWGGGERRLAMITKLTLRGWEGLGGWAWAGRAGAGYAHLYVSGPPCKGSARAHDSFL